MFQYRDTLNSFIYFETKTPPSPVNIGVQLPSTMSYPSLFLFLTLDVCSSYFTVFCTITSLFSLPIFPSPLIGVCRFLPNLNLLNTVPLITYPEFSLPHLGSRWCTKRTLELIQCIWEVLKQRRSNFTSIIIMYRVYQRCF